MGEGAIENPWPSLAHLSAGRCNALPVCRIQPTMITSLDAVDDAAFPERVLGSRRPVLVLFSASNCPPCRMMTRWLPALAREFSGQIEIVRCPVEMSAQTRRQYCIKSTPTLLLFSSGKPIAEHIGLWPVPAIRDWLHAALESETGRFESGEANSPTTLSYAARLLQSFLRGATLLRGYAGRRSEKGRPHAH